MAIMSVPHHDLRLNLKKNNSSNIPLDSKGNIYYLLYKQNITLKAQLPAALVHGENERKWRRCPWGRTQGRAGHLWREGCK